MKTAVAFRVLMAGWFAATTPRSPALAAAVPSAAPLATTGAPKSAGSASSPPAAKSSPPPTTLKAFATALAKARDAPARDALLRQLADRLKAKPSDDAPLVTALKAAVRSSDSTTKALAAENLALMAGVSKKAREAAVAILEDDDECPAPNAALAAIVVSSDETFVPVTRALRETVLEGTGEQHRLRAKIRLQKLLLGHQKLAASAIPAASAPLTPAAALGEDCNAAWPAREPDPLAKLEAQADQGKAGADALVSALKDSGTKPAEADQRLVAANALERTGVIPSDDMIAILADGVTAEPDRDARTERLLALATFAERSPVAIERLKTALLTLPDCRQAEAVALMLPSHDLRLNLYKHLPSKGRGGAIKVWIRAAAFKECK